MNASDVIVIYPGRFHPFHKGHKGVYDLLNSKFKNVYVATSDKVEPGRSPFNFDEKVEIMSMLGIEPSNILKVKQTYNGNEYMSRFNNSYGLIFAVSEKDMDDDPRFNFPSSGQSLKKDGTPAYLQKFTRIEDVEDMTKHGYVMTVPTTSFKVAGHDVNSASQIRNLLGTDNVDDAKQAFVDLYDKYNETVFNMIRNKLGGKTMENFDLNELRKLAGLNEVDVEDDEYADVPGFKEKPMFDQLGKIIDSDEMSKDGDDIKNPLNSVKTDDGEEVEVSVGEAKALKRMMEMLPSARMGEEKSAREKFLDTIQQSEGLHSMIEFARGKGLVEEADVEEGNAFAKKVRDLKAQGKKKGTKFELDGEEYALEDLDLDDIRRDFGVEEGRVKDMGMDQADAFYDKVAELVDNNNDLGKAVVDAWDDEDENPPEWALDDETRAILVNAGKIEPEPEEPEMEESEIPEGDDMQKWLAISEQYQLDENMLSKIRSMGASGVGFFQKLGSLVKFLVFNVDKQLAAGIKGGIFRVLANLSGALRDFFIKGADFTNSFAVDMAGASDDTVNRLDNYKQDMEQELIRFRNYLDQNGRIPIIIDFLENDLDDFMKRLSKGSERGMSRTPPEKGMTRTPPEKGMTKQPPETGMAEEGAKPDYIDLDGDGDREESMKKAAKDKKEKDKKKDESFDPRMEPSKKDLAINHMMDGDFEAAGGVLGGSEKDIMDEWNEYCSMRGLDRKDALNDIDHVENVVDEMMSSMDDKDFPYEPYEMESLEEDNDSELSQAYDKVYAMTVKPRSSNPEIGMGDDALDQMERYAPKFSDALEKYGDIESIEAKDSANVQDYIRELEYVLFQMEESVNLEELNRMRHLAGLEEMSLDDPITRQQFMKFGKIRQKFVSIFGKDAVDIIDKEWEEQKRSKKDKADPDETFAMAYQKAKSQKPKQLSMDI